MDTIICYTDGSAIGNNAKQPGPCGYAVYFPQSRKLFVEHCPGTNNEAEMAAVCIAVAHAPANCTLEVHTDSQIALGLLAGGWSTDLIHLLGYKRWYYSLLFEKHITVDFVKVKGHSGDSGNEIVDKASKERARAVYALAPEKRYTLESYALLRTNSSPFC